MLVLTGMSVVSVVRTGSGTPAQQVLQIAIGTAIWTFLIWKIWTRPRRWGLGIGILLLVMLAFQTHLWRLAVTNPRQKELRFDPSILSFVIYEIPLVLAAICCILLRWRYPDETKPIS